MSGWLDTKVFSLLENGLDGLSMRNKVLSNNIANVDTPNFKRSDVNFNEILLNEIEQSSGLELKKTKQQHLSGPGSIGSQFVVQDKNTSYRNDGNNVDIDLEMTRLAENTLQYNALTQALTSQLSLLRQVVQE
ncbi:MAG: flagellar basal body rod protein FlgB [Eubacteriales bacterium]